MEPQGGPLAGAPSFMVVRACGESHAVNGPAQRVSQSAHGPPSPGFLLRCSGAPRLGFAAESSQPRRFRSGLGRGRLAAPYHRRVVAAVAGPGPEGLPRQVDRPGGPMFTCPTGHLPGVSWQPIHEPFAPRSFRHGSVSPACCEG